MTALELLKNQMKSAHDTFESTVADIQPENLHVIPKGTALPLGSIYAHLILSEDVLVQSLLLKKQPLFASSWTNKTGIDKPMPSWESPEWSKENTEWARSVKIDLPQLREYSKAVYAATDEYLNSVKDEDLNTEIDMGVMGKFTLANFIAGLLIGHTFSLTGEISVLKGLQGLKGYPF